MTTRLLPAALVLGILATACGTAPPPPVTFGSGVQFVPQVADALDDVGRFPSVGVDAQGTPYVVYFGLLPTLKKGEIAPTRPVSAPPLPAVLMASTAGGIWTRGAVAMQKTVPNVTIPFGPAIVPEVKSIAPETVNGTALAVDGSGGFHVAWSADTGLWYAESAGPTGSFTARRVVPLKPPLKSAGVLGQPSVAVDAGGTAWIAYTQSFGRGTEVLVRSSQGNASHTDTVASVPRSAASARAAVAAPGGPPVVLYSDGTSVRAAVVGRGASSVVERGADGFGLSLAAAKDGTLEAAYYAGNEVHVASSKGGGSWKVSTVARVGTGSNQAGRSTGIAVDGSGKVTVAWYDPGTDSVRLAAASDDKFTLVQMKGTLGGDMPSLAAAPDGSAVYLAWYAETGQDLILGTYGEAGGLQLAIQSPTPTGGTTISTGACPPPATKLDISAQGIAFDKTCLAAPAKKPFTVTFDNKETDGTVHNFVIYSADPLSNPSAKDLGGAKPNQPVAAGQSATYNVNPQPAGTYFFRCDFHPTQMNGQFVVK